MSIKGRDVKLFSKRNNVIKSRLTGKHNISREATLYILDLFADFKIRRCCRHGQDHDRYQDHDRRQDHDR